MNLAKRAFYFIVGSFFGIGLVFFIAKKKQIKFPYGPDARTLKSIRVKPYRIFSSQAKEALQIHGIDSLRMAYLLEESDVNFSESMTDTSQPCQTYQLYGTLQDKEVAMRIKRCDSTATFEEIIIN
ncbi:MAG: DUF4258 domain-containing protein [Flavicella sp.]